MPGGEPPTPSPPCQESANTPPGSNPVARSSDTRRNRRAVFKPGLIDGAFGQQLTGTRLTKPRGCLTLLAHGGGRVRKRRSGERPDLGSSRGIPAAALAIAADRSRDTARTGFNGRA